MQCLCATYIFFFEKKKYKLLKALQLSFVQLIFSWVCLGTAIVLPEQTIVADRTDMAVNRKGLTLRELLQQTSHHNSKFRRGNSDLFYL
jgi:hypothetical protein